MNLYVKHRIYGLESLACIVGVLYCFSQIIPAGLAGEVSQKAGYVLTTCVLLIVGVLSSIISTYLRGQASGSTSRIVAEAEMDALSHGAQSSNRQTLASPQMPKTTRKRRT